MGKMAGTGGDGAECRKPGSERHLPDGSLMVGNRELEQTGKLKQTQISSQLLDFVKTMVATGGRAEDSNFGGSSSDVPHTCQRGAVP